MKEELTNGNGWRGPYDDDEGVVQTISNAILLLFISTVMRTGKYDDDLKQSDFAALLKILILKLIL